MSKLLEQINIESRIGSIKDLVFPVSNTYDFSNVEKVVFINTGDVHEGKFLHKDYSNTKKLPGQAKKIIELGDIVFSEIRPKNRHYALVDFDSKDYVVSTKLIVLKVKENIDPKFAYIVLTADQNLREFQNIAESRSGTFPQITFEAIADYEVNIPDLPTQRKIAEILSAYDTKIENNNKIIKNLEATAQIIFNEWFVNFRFPGYEKAKMIESEMEEIPEGWKFDSVTEIFDINPQTKVTDSPDVPYIEMRDLSESNMTFSYEQKRKPVAGSRFKNHDTLIARITPCLENGKTGYVYCLEDTEVGVGSTEFLVLRPKESQFREFTYLLARSATFRSFAIGRMIGSSGRQRVSGDDITRYEFVKPEPAIIKKFHGVVAPMFTLIKSFSNENISLKSQRDQLLTKLI